MRWTRWIGLALLGYTAKRWLQRPAATSATAQREPATERSFAPASAANLADEEPDCMRDAMSKQRPDLAAERAADNGIDTPNAAERLQRTHLGGAFAGIGSTLPTGDGQVPLIGGDPAARDPDQPVPGLPDFSRGA